MTGLHGLPSLETYHARSFVRTLRIPIDLYLDFVRRNDRRYGAGDAVGHVLGRSRRALGVRMS